MLPEFCKVHALLSKVTSYLQIVNVVCTKIHIDVKNSDFGWDK
ncbi:MAG: hypothetical protein OFPI_31560 [Osedax symbiont Rs2]|nr:MAG: hypothetical protein OFPI_31560 [Osedax symbiont Rs2]